MLSGGNNFCLATLYVFTFFLFLIVLGIIHFNSLFKILFLVFSNLLRTYVLKLLTNYINDLFV